MQDASVRTAIAGLGVVLGPAVLQRSMALFRDEQLRAASAMPHLVAEIPYGTHARQRLDVYRPDAAMRTPVPVLVWVHGGGFVRGEKSSPDHPFNAHVGRWAAREGLLGVVMNYRLAPEHRWPAGGEDVAAVVDWVRANAARYGGDPGRIVLAGTSAGSVHIATYIRLHADDLLVHGHDSLVRGAVLLSGLYGATPLDAQDHAYFGEQSLQPNQVTLDAVASIALPLFVACAEFDPPRFQAETLALMRRAVESLGRMPRAHYASGHNHYTLAMHLGTSDARLGDEILSFVRDVT